MHVFSIYYSLYYVTVWANEIHMHVFSIYYSLYYVTVWAHVAQTHPVFKNSSNLAFISWSNAFKYLVAMKQWLFCHA